MSLKSEHWGIIAKLTYRYFLRTPLKKLAVSTTNTTIDDETVAFLDKLAGIKE